MSFIKEDSYKTLWLSKGFSLILSDTWNDDPELLESYGDIIKGSFSFKFNADFAVRRFDCLLLSFIQSTSIIFSSNRPRGFAICK